MKNVLKLTILILVCGIVVTCKKDDNPAPDPNVEVMHYYENKGEIGQAGGSIILDDPLSDLNGAGVIIPEGALKQITNISFTVNKNEIAPTDSTAIIVSFSPEGLTFNEPIQILLPYNGSGTPTAWYLNEDKELEKIKIISVYKGIVTAEIDHFSDYYVGEGGVLADINLYKDNNKIKCSVTFHGLTRQGELAGIDYIPVRTTATGLTLGKLYNCLQFLEEYTGLMAPVSNTWVAMEIELRESRNVLNNSIDKKEIAIKRLVSQDGTISAEYWKKNSNGDFEPFSKPIVLTDKGSFNTHFSGKTIVVEFDEDLDPDKEYFIKTSWVLCDNAEGKAGLNTRWSNKYKFSTKTERNGIWTLSSINGTKQNPDTNNNWVKDEFEIISTKPTVATSGVSNITSTSAKLGGNVTDDGNAEVTERGIYYGVSQSPENSGSKVSIGYGNGSFSKTISGLTSNKTYYVKAYAKNSEGFSYGEQITFKTSSAGSAPVADFVASSTSGNVGQSIQYTDKSTNTPTSWKWDFGDGTTSTKQNPTHTYTTSGTYTISLKATNAFGSNTKTKTNLITISKAGSAPVANFSANSTNITKGESVSFTDKSTNTPTSWAWDFGDGGTSMSQNPTHIFTTKGTYTVSLKVKNQYGEDVKTMENLITVSEDDGCLDCETSPQLVAYFPFTGNADDVSGNGYDGIVKGAQLDEDRFGKSKSAYRFNGISNYIITEKKLDLGSQDLTISLWYKSTAISSEQQDIICNMESFSRGFTVYSGDKGKAINCSYYTRDNQFLAAWPVTESSNSWTHITFCCSHANSNAKLYINGNMAMEMSMNNINLGNGASSELTIGYANWSRKYFTGLIDDIRIYNYCISDSEISNLYHENGWDGETGGVETGTLTDQNGNTYKTVKIGEQWWMAENLKATHYADGTSIPHITDDNAWGKLGDNDIDKAYCYYNNDKSLGYGALYTYATATNGDNSGNNVQGVCPTGWHLPSNAEWEKLENYLADNGYNYDGSTGGGGSKIGKALASQTGWLSSWDLSKYDVGGSPEANNTSGFSGLPGGMRLLGGMFNWAGDYGHWWSSTNSSNSKYAFHRFLRYSRRGITELTGPKSSGFSVRCVRDE